MAIKLLANYSKRLGLPGYSSHQFSVSVETELRDLSEADTEMSNLYHQLQQNVDAQIQETGFVPSEAYGNQSPNRQTPSSQTSNQNPNEWSCSEKQESLIRKLVNEHALDKNEVDHLARQRFGKGVRLLNKMEASGLIDELIDTYGGQQSHAKGHRNNSAYRGANGRTAA